MLSEIILEIEKRDNQRNIKVREYAYNKWNSIAKPIHGLGEFEDIIINIAGIQNNINVDISKRAVVIFCSDNGIVAEGVSQAGMEVTGIVAENITYGSASICHMAETAGADCIPIDIGIAKQLTECGNKYPIIEQVIRRCTGNIAKEESMTVMEANEAILVGVKLVEKLKNKGYKLIATGEMGIGNTTVSSALAAIMTGEDVAAVTGKGAGGSLEMYQRKIKVLKTVVSRLKKTRQLFESQISGKYNERIEVILELLSKAGGLDIAGMIGLYLGGALYGIPIITDGFISNVAALMAVNLCSECKNIIIASHTSAEPAARLILEKIGIKAVINANMCLGEGTGALMILPLLDMALSVYNNMSTFEDIEIESYTVY
jgi:NaMN:DMB phosphoribosyltransferase